MERSLKNLAFGLSLRVPIENRGVAIRPKGSLRGQSPWQTDEVVASPEGVWQPPDK